MAELQYPSKLWRHPAHMDWAGEIGERVDWPKGKTLLDAGQVPDCVYCIIEGKVIAYEIAKSGRERIYSYIDAGSLILEALLIEKQASPVSFVAATPVAAWAVSREALMGRLVCDPQAALDIIEALSYKFLMAMQQVRERVQHNMTWQFCALLLSFAEPYGEAYDGKTLIKEKMSQQTLANILGANRITLVRIIRKLQALGLLELINGFYCIRNISDWESYMAHCDACGE